MENGINNSPKQWTKINDTTKNKEYQAQLEKKISSILDGKETISVDKLKQNSLFNSLSEQAALRFNQIAGIDGDKTTFNADELKVLFSLTDASLQNDKFVFDGKDAVDSNSGLEQANDNEVKAMIKNLVQSDMRKRIETIDTRKYDNTKTFDDKINSSDVDEAMLAVQDKLTLGINKSTGKPISIVQASMLLKDLVKEADGYDAACALFTERTGISASNFDRLRCMGDGDSFTIGDWKYEGAATINKDSGRITNTKTGETVNIRYSLWRNSTNHTVPASNGWVCMVNSYDDGKNTKIKFTYDDGENIAPTSAKVTTDGTTKNINYNQKFKIDPEVYNYQEISSSRINL